MEIIGLFIEENVPIDVLFSSTNHVIYFVISQYDEVKI